MKAVHVNSGKVYQVKDIMSGQITLTSVETGNIRKVSHEHFEEFFTLKNNDEVEVGGCTLKTELVEASKRASEILSEVGEENTDPTPKTPNTRKRRKPKPQTAVPDKPQKPDKKPDKTPKAQSTGSTVSLKQICSDHNIDPAKARKILRKHDIPKPYEWSDPSPIIKLLKK